MGVYYSHSIGKEDTWEYGRRGYEMISLASMLTVVSMISVSLRRIIALWSMVKEGKSTEHSLMTNSEMYHLPSYLEGE